MPDSQTVTAAHQVAELTGIDWQAGLLSSTLGPRDNNGSTEVRCLLPGARAVALIAWDTDQELTALEESDDAGLFVGRLNAAQRYRLRITWPDAIEVGFDPYSFVPVVDELDRYLLAEGRHYQLGQRMGAQLMVVDGIAGARFAVWAPNARQVSVVGDFNFWGAERHPLRRRHGASVWELFIPGVAAGSHYRYRIIGADGSVLDKADPFACTASPAPSTSSVVGCAESFAWSDAAWMESRADRHRPSRPHSIYEVHAGSWRRVEAEQGRSMRWSELADSLIPYALAQGFTHIELMPIAAHPFGGSWGYQPLGLFAPQPDFGSPSDFAAFVDAAHGAGLGVLLDWVPAHFPSDAHGLARFDGTPLFEHADPREGLHRDWGTLIFDLGRPEVRAFLISSALHWIEHFHVDGLRVDAVASMLYRDYSRAEGEWIPNRYGGRENLEAIAFLRQLNDAVRDRAPGALMIAEESTAWPGVTSPTDQGGLGFSYKWNMGWMNDTLQYIQKDPIHRRHEHHKLTFGLVYAFNEQFVLPLSHDEVVHGKGSLIDKMPGDRWQRFAGLRAYLAFMWAHPGKKLLFMGGELAQWREWNHDAALDWGALENADHAGVQTLVRDVNGLYCKEAALHERDTQSAGFEWLVDDDRDNSLLVLLRRGEADDAALLAVCNFTPLPRPGYRIGLPAAGDWYVCFNSDAAVYAGSNYPVSRQLTSAAEPSHGRPFSMVVDVPPLATLYLKRLPEISR